MDDFFVKYYECVYLLKAKYASSIKLEDLILLLNYFNENYYNFNKEELLFIKNVIMIANAILNTTKLRSKLIKEEYNKCYEIINEINNKHSKK